MEELMKKYLEDPKNNINFFLNGKQVNEYIGIIKSVCENILYDSKIHGLYHSQKVALFAFILACNSNLNDIDKKIIMDAAIYHDCGRENDMEDSFHGLASTIKLKKIIDNSLYTDANSIENYNILMAIIESHSAADKIRDNVFEGYFSEEESTKEIQDRLVLLNNILKDADALDRCRFADGYAAKLDEKFLRLPISKTLVPLAEKINDYYKENLLQKTNLDGIPFFEGACVHSIGNDYFKIGSILKHGILSPKKIEELRISGAKNFNGGNSENWISVIDKTLLPSKHTGYKEFIEPGISFECSNVLMCDPMPNAHRSKALEKGLPYDKSNHEDEKFVYEKIDKDAIEKVVFTETVAKKLVSSSNFIYNSLHFHIFSSRVEYYLSCIKNIIHPETKKELYNHLDQYEKELREYHSSKLNNVSIDTKRLENSLNTISKNINKILQDVIGDYYSKELDKDVSTITNKDIIIHEIRKSGIAFDIEENNGSISIELKKEKQKVLIKKNN